MYRKPRQFGSYRPPYGYTNWSEWHESKRDALSRKFGGIDTDVIDAFLALDAERLYKFFDAYERKHGSAARAYARKTYHQWKKGNIQISAQTAERLLDLLPPFLSSDTKYELVRKLRDRSRKKQTYSFTVDTVSWASTVMPIVHSLIQGSSTTCISAEVSSRLSWLSAGDAKVAEAIFAESEARTAIIAAGYLKREFANIHRLLLAEGKKTITHVLTLPYGTINLTVVRNATMDSEKKDLIVRKDDEALAPISSGNLLDEAIKNLSPEQRREIAQKASEEALRLQVTAHEAERRHAYASRDVDQFIDNVHRLDNRASEQTSFEAQGEFHGASGVTTVKVKRDGARIWLYVAGALLLVLILVLLTRR